MSIACSFIEPQADTRPGETNQQLIHDTAKRLGALVRPAFLKALGGKFTPDTLKWLVRQAEQADSENSLFARLTNPKNGQGMFIDGEKNHATAMDLIERASELYKEIYDDSADYSVDVDEDTDADNIDADENEGVFDPRADENASDDVSVDDPEYTRKNASGFSTSTPVGDFIVVPVEGSSVTEAIILSDPKEKANVDRKKKAGKQDLHQARLGEYLYDLSQSESAYTPNPGAWLAGVLKEVRGKLWDRIYKSSAEAAMFLWQAHKRSAFRPLELVDEAVSRRLSVDELTARMHSKFGFGDRELTLRSGDLLESEIDITQFSLASVTNAFVQAIRISGQNGAPLAALQEAMDAANNMFSSDKMSLGVDTLVLYRLLQETPFDAKDKAGNSVKGLWETFNKLTDLRIKYSEERDANGGKDLSREEMQKIFRGVRITGEKVSPDVAGAISKEYTDPSAADIVTTTSVDRLSHRDIPSSVVEVVVTDKKGKKVTHRLDSRLLIRSVRARKTADYKHYNRSTQRFLEALRQVMTQPGFVSASLIPVVNKDGEYVQTSTKYPITAENIRKGKLPFPKEAVLQPATDKFPDSTIGSMNVGDEKSNIAVGAGKKTVAEKKRIRANRLIALGNMLGVPVRDQLYIDAGKEVPDKAAVANKPSVRDIILERLEGDIAAAQAIVDDNTKPEGPRKRAAARLADLLKARSEHQSEGAGVGAHTDFAAIERGMQERIDKLEGNPNRTKEETTQLKDLKDVFGYLSERAEQALAEKTADERRKTFPKKIQAAKEQFSDDFLASLQRRMVITDAVVSGKMSASDKSALNVNKMIEGNPDWNTLDVINLLWKEAGEKLDTMRVQEEQAKKTGNKLPSEHWDTRLKMQAFQSLAEDAAAKLLRDEFDVADYTGERPHDMYSNNIELSKEDQISEISDHMTDRAWIRGFVQWAEEQSDYALKHARDMILNDGFAIRFVGQDLDRAISKQNWSNARVIAHAEALERALGFRPAPFDVGASIGDVRAQRGAQRYTQLLAEVALKRSPDAEVDPTRQRNIELVVKPFLEKYDLHDDSKDVEDFLHKVASVAITKAENLKQVPPTSLSLRDMFNTTLIHLNGLLFGVGAASLEKDIAAELSRREDCAPQNIPKRNKSARAATPSKAQTESMWLLPSERVNSTVTKAVLMERTTPAQRALRRSAIAPVGLAELKYMQSRLQTGEGTPAQQTLWRATLENRPLTDEEQAQVRADIAECSKGTVFESASTDKLMRVLKKIESKIGLSCFSNAVDAVDVFRIYGSGGGNFNRYDFNEYCAQFSHVIPSSQLRRDVAHKQKFRAKIKEEAAAAKKAEATNSHQYAKDVQLYKLIGSEILLSKTILELRSRGKLKEPSKNALPDAIRQEFFSFGGVVLTGKELIDSLEKHRTDLKNRVSEAIETADIMEDFMDTDAIKRLEKIHAVADGARD